MLSNTAIIQKAFQSTRNNPLLWLFGLFVIGGFNLNFLHFQNIPLKRVIQENILQDIVAYLQIRPGVLAFASALVLFVTLIGLLITNWSRIMLILLGKEALEAKIVVSKKPFYDSKNSLTGIIKISLMTSALMLIVAGILIIPTLWLPMENPLRLMLLQASIIVFLPLAFTISCVNIFSGFFLILYKIPLNKALNCGTDFFISFWTRILGLVLVLIIIYLVSFAVGVSIIFLAKEILELGLLILVKFHILPLSAIILMLKTISTLLFWFLLSGLSVFFNQALLILFLDLSKPIKDPEYKKDNQPVPAAIA